MLEYAAKKEILVNLISQSAAHNGPPVHFAVVLCAKQIGIVHIKRRIDFFRGLIDQLRRGGIAIALRGIGIINGIAAAIGKRRGDILVELVAATEACAAGVEFSREDFGSIVG